MADSNTDITLLEIENEFLRETISKHQQQVDLMTRREVKVKKIIDALQQQRDQCTEDYKCLSATTKDQIDQLKDKIKKYKAQIQDYHNKFEENRLQYTDVQNTYEKLTNIYEEIHNLHRQLDNKHEEIHNLHRQLLFQHEELAKCNAAFFEKSIEVRDLRDKLVKNEEKYKNLLLHNQMALVRSGLTKFEETKIPEFFPSKRGELYTDFLKSIKNIDLPPNTATCVKNLFLKLNTSVHKCHSIGDTVIVEEGENAFSNNELKLLEAVWKLSPLNKGKLVVKR